MQIILISRHLTTARTIDIMPRHVVGAAFALAAVVVAMAALLSWLSVHWRLPLVEDLLVSVQLQEARKTRVYLENNLQLMANRLGELQARVLQLDALGERVSGLAGIKRERPASDDAKLAPADKAPAADKTAAVGDGGKGGPFVPAAVAPSSLTPEALQAQIDRLTGLIDDHGDDMAYLEFKILEKRVKDRLLPTMVPVKNAHIGSGFGPRIDPILGLRAMHEGLDFAAEIGTPVMAAADGVVRTAERHSEFGNMIDIDHGAGLTSRYAHLSRIDVVPGEIVKRGEQIGAVGTTGRSTGPHLHFEVRMFGVAQNPTFFLKQQGPDFALAKRR